MDISEVRRQNLKAIKDAWFGPERGSQKRIAEALGKTPDYISRCLVPADRTHHKNIGEDLAREFEERLGLERYAMDKPDLATDGSLLSSRGKYRYHSAKAITRDETTSLKDRPAMSYQVIEVDRELLAEVIQNADNICGLLGLNVTAREKASAVAAVYARAVAKGLTAGSYDPDMMVVALATLKDQTAPQ